METLYFIIIALLIIILIYVIVYKTKNNTSLYSINNSKWKCSDYDMCVQDKNGSFMTKDECDNVCRKNRNIVIEKPVYDYSYPRYYPQTLYNPIYRRWGWRHWRR